MGHSLLYRYGLLKQQVVNGEQREFAHEWLSRGHFFLDEKKDKAVKVYFDGKVEEFVDYFGVYHYSAKDAICVEAVPYDLMMTGYKLEGNAPLRLWKANYLPEKTEDLNEYETRLQESIRKDVNAINDYLYPADDNDYGKALRLKQEYLLSSASMQNIVNDHIEKGHKITSLPKWVSVHLNDTHPVLSVVELMRILLDKYHLSWETSWSIVNRMVTYTNHTVLSESLEVQPMWLIEKHMPRIAIIIKK